MLSAQLWVKYIYNIVQPISISLNWNPRLIKQLPVLSSHSPWRLPFAFCLCGFDYSPYFIWVGQCSICSFVTAYLTLSSKFIHVLEPIRISFFLKVTQYSTVHSIPPFLFLSIGLLLDICVTLTLASVNDVALYKYILRPCFWFLEGVCMCRVRFAGSRNNLTFDFWRISVLPCSEGFEEIALLWSPLILDTTPWQLDCGKACFGSIWQFRGHSIRHSFLNNPSNKA